MNDFHRRKKRKFTKARAASMLTHKLRFTASQADRVCERSQKVSTSPIPALRKISSIFRLKMRCRLNIALFINKHSRSDIYFSIFTLSLVHTHHNIIKSSSGWKAKRDENKIHVYCISFEHLHRRLIKFHIELCTCSIDEAKHFKRRLCV